ncbi:hypothetical protein ACVFYP_24585 [Roseomonas sp. F4]
MRWILLLLLALALPARAQTTAPEPGLLALAGAELLLPHLARPAPFARPLAVTRALTEGDPSWAAVLAPLEAVAPLGAPLPRQLAASFGAAAEAAVLAEMGQGDGRWQRWMAAAMRLGARFGGGDSPALAATAAAEALLDQGALEAADQALATLHGPAAEALAEWRAALQRRRAADAAGSALAGLVTQRAAGR